MSKTICNSAQYFVLVTNQIQKSGNCLAYRTWPSHLYPRDKVVDIRLSPLLTSIDSDAICPCYLMLPEDRTYQTAGADADCGLGELKPSPGLGEMACS